MKVLRSSGLAAICLFLMMIAAPAAYADVIYTFSGVNSGPYGGDGLPVALQLTTSTFITSLTPVFAPQLDSCTNCLVSSSIPAAEMRPSDILNDAIGFVDINQIEFFYRFQEGAFSTPGTYTTLSQASFPGTLAVTVVPEPNSASLALGGGLMLGLVCLFRRKTLLALRHA